MDFDSSADPAAEFLAREQDQLAGIGDDIIPGTEPVAAPAGDAPFKPHSLCPAWLLLSSSCTG